MGINSPCSRPRHWHIGKLCLGPHTPSPNRHLLQLEAYWGNPTGIKGQQRGRRPSRILCIQHPSKTTLCLCALLQLFGPSAGRARSNKQNSVSLSSSMMLTSAVQNKSIVFFFVVWLGRSPRRRRKVTQVRKRHLPSSHAMQAALSRAAHGTVVSGPGLFIRFLPTPTIAKLRD